MHGSMRGGWRGARRTSRLLYHGYKDNGVLAVTVFAEILPSNDTAETGPAYPTPALSLTTADSVTLVTGNSSDASWSSGRGQPRLIHLEVSSAEGEGRPAPRLRSGRLNWDGVLPPQWS